MGESAPLLLKEEEEAKKEIEWLMERRRFVRRALATMICCCCTLLVLVLTLLLLELLEVKTTDNDDEYYLVPKPTAAPTVSSTETRRVSRRDLLENKDLRRYFDTFNDTTNSNSSDYLPEYIDFSWTNELIQGQIGADAALGYVAFCLYQEDSSGKNAAYLFVVALNGDIVRAKALQEEASLVNTHVDVIKPLDQDTFILTGNANSTEVGHTFLWHWRSNNTVTTISRYQNVNSHDIQLSSQQTKENFWIPSSYGVNKYQKDTFADGPTESYAITNYSDINHAQLIQNDTLALLSSRYDSQLIMYNMSSQSIEWRCGGMDGDLDLYDDIMNQMLPSGQSLTYGQHNAESYGSNQIYVFDNNYHSDSNNMGPQNRSRLVIIEIDAVAKSAHLIWQYVLPGFSVVFGDADKLPTSNIAYNWWPTYITSKTGEYDVYIAELAPQTQQDAWSLSVMGDGCDLTTYEYCERTIRKGWKVYSIERFYDHPLVYALSCSRDDPDDSSLLRLSFASHTTYKIHNTDPGFFEWSTGDSILAASHFDWEAHWLRTDISTFASYSSTDNAALDTTLTVTNKFGQSTTKAISCPPPS